MNISSPQLNCLLDFTLALIVPGTEVAMLWGLETEGFGVIILRGPGWSHRREWFTRTIMVSFELFAETL